LRFQKTALAQVVAEINRYRPGRLLLLADGVAERPVSGRFRIDDLDKAIAQIQRLFHLTGDHAAGRHRRVALSGSVLRARYFYSANCCKIRTAFSIEIRLEAWMVVVSVPLNRQPSPNVDPIRH